MSFASWRAAGRANCRAAAPRWRRAGACCPSFGSRRPASHQPDEEADAGGDREGDRRPLTELALELAPQPAPDAGGLLTGAARRLLDRAAQALRQAGDDGGDQVWDEAAELLGVGGRRHAEMLEAAFELP